MSRSKKVKDVNKLFNEFNIRKRKGVNHDDILTELQSQLEKYKMYNVEVLIEVCRFDPSSLSVVDDWKKKQQYIIRELVKKVDINSMSNFLSFDPHCPISEVNNYEALKLLLELGGNIDFFNLNYYVRKGYSDLKEVVQILIQNNRYDIINAEDASTPLMYCLNSEQIDILIAAKADVNAIDNEGNSVLMSFCEKETCDEEGILKLINAGANVNAINNDDETALQKCCYHEDNLAKKLKVLLEAKADVNARDENGVTALMKCCYLKESKEGIEILLSAGADVNAVSDYGKTALMICFNSEGIKVLLSAGANVKIKDQQNRTVLMNDDLDEKGIKILIEAGADVNVVDDWGKTALMICSSSYETMMILINAGADVRGKDISETTLMMHFCRNYKEEGSYNEALRVIDKLIELGLNVNDIDKEGNTVLMHCYRNLEVMKVLILKGVGINVQNNKGETALIKFIDNYHYNLVSTLVNAGVDVNIRDYYGKTALMYCVNRFNSYKPKDVSNILLLLVAKADFTIRDEEGQTALMKSCNIEIIRNLVAAGADMSAVDDNGKSCLMHFYDNFDGSKEKIITFLISDGKLNGENVNECIGRSALMCCKSVEEMKQLISLGADVNALYNNETVLMNFVKTWKEEEEEEKEGLIEEFIKEVGERINVNAINNENRTALMYCKKEEHVKALIAVGADVNLRDNDLKTALMHYGKRTNYNSSAGTVKGLIEALIAAGVDDINARDRAGETALIVCCMNSNVEGLNALIKAGANINDKDNEGKTALMYCRNLECVKLLIDAGVNVGARDTNLRTVLMHLVKNELSTLTFLKRVVDNINDRDVEGRTALMYCGYRVAITKALLKLGANVDLQDKEGKTALMESTNTLQMQMLINASKMDDVVNVKDNEGKSILMYDKSDSQLRMLIEAGADVNARDNEGGTVIMYGKSDSQLRMLIEGGAYVNARDNEGETALWYNIISRSQLKMLIEAGADINARNNEGETVIMRDMVGWKLRLFFNDGADINARDNEGRTALMYNYADSHFKILIEEGKKADVINARDNKGRTALMYGKSESQLRMLIEAGADINARDNEGKTALIFSMFGYMLAQHDNFSEREKVAAFFSMETSQKDIFRVNENQYGLQSYLNLLNLGADINVQDIYGNTALMYLVSFFMNDIDDDYWVDRNFDYIVNSVIVTCLENILSMVKYRLLVHRQNNEGDTVVDIYHKHQRLRNFDIQRQKLDKIIENLEIKLKNELELPLIALNSLELISSNRKNRRSSRNKPLLFLNETESVAGIAEMIMKMAYGLGDSKEERKIKDDKEREMMMRERERIERERIERERRERERREREQEENKTGGASESKDNHRDGGGKRSRKLKGSGNNNNRRKSKDNTVRRRRRSPKKK